MNFKLSEKEINMVSELAEEMRKEACDRFSLQENMQISFADRVEELDEKKEIEELCSGIHEFDELMKQMGTDNGKPMIIETLERSGLAGKSMEEQYAILAQGLQAFQADLTEKGYELGKLKDLEVKTDAEITQEDLNTMKDLMAEYLEQFALLHGEPEVMENFFRSMGEDVLEKMLEACEKDEERYYTALAIHVLVLQGRLDPDMARMGAKGIGAAAASFIAAAKVHIKGILGKISSEEVISTLKKIAGAALTILVGVAITVAAFAVGQFFAGMMLVLFGYGIIGAITSLVFGTLAFIGTADSLCGLWEGAKEAVEKAGNYAADKWNIAKNWIVETCIPALRSFWEKVKEAAAGIFASPAAAETEETEEPECFEADEMEGEIFAEA